MSVKLEKLLLDIIVDVIEKNEEIVSIAVHQRAKFEGWLKFEVIKVLKRWFPNASVEFPVGKENVDIHFDNAFLELKTANTSYSNICCESKTRPITKNIKDIIEDIAKLGRILSVDDYGYVAFVMFPLDEKGQYMKHIEKVKNALALNNGSNGCEPEMKEVRLDGAAVPLLVFVSRVYCI